MTAESAALPCPAQRKRGVALEDAIREAAYAELADVGYTQFSVEGVAARARTGKASIYRRWPTKQLLVLDALCAALPSPQQCGIAPDNYKDMSTADALRQVARAITLTLSSPAGAAMRAVKFEAASDPELAREVDERFQAPRRAALLDLLRRGVERGEVRPEAVNPLVADVLPAVLMYRVILQRERITERDITEIIEQVLIPLVEVR
ncbi:MAG: TetR family transcriptional regulator [Pseudonocardiales bacterium]|nr:MAG: TetR family transcriptional regulator [Pseudonocardiales bacterium]